jgi:hypothetical protein
MDNERNMNSKDIVRVKKDINISKALELCTLFILNINEEIGKAEVIVIESKKCTVYISKFYNIYTSIIYNKNDLCDFKFKINIDCLESI